MDRDYPCTKVVGKIEDRCQRIYVGRQRFAPQFNSKWSMDLREGKLSNVLA